MKTLFDKNTTIESLQRIDQLQANSKSIWGKMSVNEMICHVSDPFRDMLRIRNTKPAIPSLLRPLMKWLLLNEKPFSKNAPTVKPYLQSPKGTGTKPNDFLSDKEELKRLVSEFARINEGFILGKHAALGHLTKKQAGRFMWKHLDHHLRQFGV